MVDSSNFLLESAWGPERSPKRQVKFASGNIVDYRLIEHKTKLTLTRVGGQLQLVELAIAVTNRSRFMCV